MFRIERNAKRESERDREHSTFMLEKIQQEML